MSDKTPYFDDGEVKRQLITHEHDDQIVVHTHQDIEPLLDHVKAQREELHQVGARVGQDMTPVAEIPMIIWEQACREGWQHDQNKWKQWLNDPQNAPFRLTTGRV